jgi:general stress protein YciG
MFMASTSQRGAGASRTKSASGDMSVREAGRKGGETTRDEVEKGTLPADFYQQIGHKGGEIGGERGGLATKAKVQSGELPRDHYQRIGHKGGQKVRELIEKGKRAEGLN